MVRKKGDYFLLKGSDFYNALGPLGTIKRGIGASHDFNFFDIETVYQFVDSTERIANYLPVQNIEWFAKVPRIKVVRGLVDYRHAIL